ncbi:MAG: cellobiose phosphorylase, partial [bacterium]
MEKPAYRFENQAFVIADYDRQKTFASFLPGLAGKRGVPLWAFYVNRGQGICSFGLRDKNGAILEFYPGNLAYLYTSKIGFRTFVKQEGVVHEIFKPEDERPKRQMAIVQSALTISEENPELGLRVKVTYYGLPNDDLAALVRMVKIENIGTTATSLEILDGISQILPAGIDYGAYKSMSNLLRSWMDVANLEDGFAFYKLRSATGDEAETREVKDGNFYLSFVDGVQTTPIADMDLVYGYDTAMNHAAALEKQPLAVLQASFQATANKVPCGFTGATKTLAPGAVLCIDTLIGHTHDVAAIARKAGIVSHAWFEAKRIEAAAVIDELLSDVETKTAFPVFDESIRQNYLDNLLRGGFPLTVTTGAQRFVYYLYSRKHGDLERDYNFFSIAPEFYSQGNGNFRDVCQNRRNDVFFHPETGDYGIKVFASLIQADGYNPLSINGSTFEIKDKAVIPDLAAHCFSTGAEAMIPVLSGRFTPGSIVNTMEHLGAQTAMTDDALFQAVLAPATQNIEASFGEGYWTDHWTYLLDLVERYLDLFPDQKKTLLYDDRSYRYFDSPVTVRPRSEKYVVDKNGELRQYGALRHPDREKIERSSLSEQGTNWLKGADGVVETNLASKLFVLAVNKFALLDPEGLGIEMEANKPGWNDAMNGLPGICGSGMSETVELGRLAHFLQAAPAGTYALPMAFITFALALAKVDATDEFDRWEEVSTIRETYREAIRFGAGKSVEIASERFAGLVTAMVLAADQAVERAIAIGDGILPTYFYYRATKLETRLQADGSPLIGDYGLPLAKVHAFSRHRLPDFLEAPARYLKAHPEPAKAEAMAAKIKASGLYDTELKMYKTSSDLDACGHEIGRIRAFTKGWLERESNFLHMTYKYLLGLLKSGLYERFYQEAMSNLVCFMDPETYGRPTIENSSFIATSNNPNPAVRGQGFVSRLSGSTAEMLSLWTIMMHGKELFGYRDGRLTLQLKPLVPATFFTANGMEAAFIGQKIVYRNPRGVDSWLTEPGNYQLRHQGHTIKTVVGSHLLGADAAA